MRMHIRMQSMTDAHRIRAAAAARGMKLGDVAAKVGAHPAAFSALIRGRAPYPKAAEYLAKAKALLGIEEPLPIPYSPKQVTSSTGITLPIEAHNFARHRVFAGTETSISGMFMKAFEEKYRHELIEYIAENPKRATALGRSVNNPAA